MKKKLLVLATLFSAVAITLAGCGSSNDSSSEKKTKDDGKEVTLTVFDSLANYNGMQTGWFAKVVKDKFNIKLNIVQGTDTNFDTRSASGDLGDLIITGTNSGRAKKLAKSGLISDMEPYMSGMKYIKKYSGATDSVNKLAGKTSGVWGIPSSVSSQSPTTPSEGNELTYGPYLRWDIYKEIGYPKINNLDALLPVLKKMQAQARKDNPGEKIYAMSLFKDWDSVTMNNATQFPAFNGYGQLNFVLANAKGTDYQSVTKTNGEYVKALKFFNEADQMGLVDPDSTSQNYDTMFAKYQSGKALFSFWPWLGQSAYNTTANKEAGKGFMIAPVKGLKIYSAGATPNGTTTAFYLGSKAKNKTRVVKFINWLYSPEGVQDSAAQTAGTAGVKGLTWNMKNGKPTLTAFGKKAVLEGGTVKVPAKYGTGKYIDGVSQLNTPTVLGTDTDPTTKEPYYYTMWTSYLKSTSTKLDKDWSSEMGGATTTLEYLEKNKEIVVAPGASFSTPEDSSEITTLRTQIGTQIVQSSWKMAFAKNDAEFNTLLKSMQSTVAGLGYEKVLKVDMKNAKNQNKARKAIVKEYEDK